jgi:DNA replication protein DnaC
MESDNKKEPKSIAEILNNQIDIAFKMLGSKENPYERKETYMSFGQPDILRKAFKDCFIKYDKTIKLFTWLPEYDQVIDWLADNKGKGLFLCGSYGRGKSNIINAVIRPLFQILDRRSIPGCHASLLPIEKSYGIYGKYTYENLLNKKIIYIDELGTEKMVTDYGEKYEAFIEILNNAEQNLNILIISSNLTADLFLARYGDRSLDRIERLCRIIKFEGDSLRPK